MTNPAATAPLPPLRLAERVGLLSSDHVAQFPETFLDDLLSSGWWDPDDPFASYLALGETLADTIRAAVPQDWSFQGRRILDFGCGAGRVLRHFADEAPGVELHGCDIDAPSIEWMRAHLCPPLHAHLTSERPPLPFEDGSFDLIYAMSVYTHLTDSWSAWMVEHRRLLAPGGLLLASFCGPSIRRWVDGTVDLDPEREGMVVRNEDTGWDEGGPFVMHAPWWIREHWGRAFEILALIPDGLAFPAGAGQGWALLRRDDRAVSRAALEAG